MELQAQGEVLCVYPHSPTPFASRQEHLEEGQRADLGPVGESAMLGWKGNPTQPFPQVLPATPLPSLLQLLGISVCKTSGQVLPTMYQGNGSTRFFVTHRLVKPLCQVEFKRQTIECALRKRFFTTQEAPCFTPPQHLYSSCSPPIPSIMFFPRIFTYV